MAIEICIYFIYIYLYFIPHYTVSAIPEPELTYLALNLTWDCQFQLKAIASAPALIPNASGIYNCYHKQ